MTQRIIAECDFCRTPYEQHMGSTFRTYLQTSPHQKIDNDLCPECTKKVWIIKHEVRRESELNASLKYLADK